MNDQKLENEKESLQDKNLDNDQETGSSSSDEENKLKENSAIDENLEEPSVEDLSADTNLELLKEENKNLNDRILRVMADMENLRRRKDREIIDKEKYAITKFAKEVLSIGDNIQRAIEAVPEDAIESDAHLKSLLEGVQMTERELTNIFERQGIKKIDPSGQPFDPNLHQAMFEVPSPDVAAGTVVQVVQAGYVIGERTLRPALVGISKGGVKESKSEEPPELPKKEEKKQQVKQESENKNSDQDLNKKQETSANTSDEKPSAKTTDEVVGKKVDKSA